MVVLKMVVFVVYSGCVWQMTERCSAREKMRGEGGENDLKKVV
jgi:hypothetical protein